MIGWLSGTVRELDPAGSVIVESSGIGYEISLSLQTLCKLKQGEKTELSIHTHVREDQITLFGFSNNHERQLFRKLTTVSGIGARMALNLMSGMSTEELVGAIESSDDASIARTPGIGKKTAQRLILELQGKLGIAAATSAGALPSNSNEDVRSALLNLGYKPTQIDAAIKKVEPSDFETMFRNTLKALG